MRIASKLSSFRKISRFESVRDTHICLAFWPSKKCTLNLTGALQSPHFGRCMHADRAGCHLTLAHLSHRFWRKWWNAGVGNALGVLIVVGCESRTNATQLHLPLEIDCTLLVKKTLLFDHLIWRDSEAGWSSIVSEVEIWSMFLFREAGSSFTTTTISISGSEDVRLVHWQENSMEPRSPYGLGRRHKTCSAETHQLSPSQRISHGGYQCPVPWLLHQSQVFEFRIHM